MREMLPDDRPALVLAPMQDVTDLPFMRVLARRGAPDWLVTEYFRVHPDSCLNPYILRSITENRTGVPVFAQVIGCDLPSLVRTARQLADLPVAGIDLNLGCPAPIVCRKQAGGGLLRDPAAIDRLLGALRAAIPGRFTVKTRVGYAAVGEFPGLLEIFRRHGLDGLTVHGRTVLERYQTPVHPECVRQAVAAMSCPVIANGNIVDPATGLAFLDQSGAAGLMIGRGAIRNPWIFSQLRAVFAGTPPNTVDLAGAGTGLVEGSGQNARATGGPGILPGAYNMKARAKATLLSTPPPQPTHRELLDYVLDLYQELALETRKFIPNSHVQRMKKTLAYISHGLAGTFEHDMRRATTPEDFFRICHHHLDHDTPLPVQPPADSKLFCGFAALRDP